MTNLGADRPAWLDGAGVAAAAPQILEASYSVATPVQPTTYAQPVMTTFAQPVVTTFAQPVVTTFAQPVVTTFAQPVVTTFAQPVVLAQGSWYQVWGWYLGFGWRGYGWYEGYVWRWSPINVSSWTEPTLGQAISAYAPVVAHQVRSLLDDEERNALAIMGWVAGAILVVPLALAAAGVVGAVEAIGVVIGGLAWLTSSQPSPNTTPTAIVAGSGY